VGNLLKNDSIDPVFKSGLKDTVLLQKTWLFYKTSEKHLKRDKVPLQK
jgi:hypothetical protein